MEANSVPRFSSEVAKLSHQRHLSFMDRVISRGQTYLIDQLGENCPANLRQSFLTLQQLKESEADAFKAKRTSSYTAQIREADAARDSTLSGIKFMLDALIKIGTDDQKSAAEIVKKVIGKYKVRTRNSYEDQGIKIAQLCEEIDATDSVMTALKTCKLTPQITTLKSQNAECRRLVNLRNEERSQIEPLAITKARKSTDVAYFDFIQLLNAYSLVTNENGVSIYDDLINTFNADIAYYKNWVLRRQRDASDANPDAPISETSANNLNSNAGNSIDTADYLSDNETSSN